MNRPSPFGTPPPFGGSRPFDGSSLLDRFHGKPVGEVRFPTAAAPPRPAVDPDYLRKVRENDPWPEGSSCAPPSPKPLVPPVAVTLSNCRFLTPVDQLRFNESFEMAVDVRRFAPGKTRRAFFTLHYEIHHEGKTERGTAFQGTEGFPDSDRETHTVTAKGFLFIMAPLLTGATIDFWLTATHQEAAGPVESPKVNVPLLRHAHWMGGTDILFGLGSCCPRLGGDGRLAAVLAAALQRGAKPADPKIPESVVCFGFASASGSPESNRKLSRRRAEAVKAILDRNHDAWHDLAHNHFGTHDIQTFLADFDTLESLGCDPGPVDGVDGPRTHAAIEAFQRHANERWKLGLIEDGLCGPRTWGAVLRALVACVQTELGQDPSQEPVWKPMPWGRKGEGVYANGEDFASEQEDPDERSVQIAFFAQGSEPRMEDHKGSSKASLKQNPTQDPALVAKHFLPVSSCRDSADDPISCHYLEIPDHHFRPGGHMPCAGPVQDLVVRLASAIAFARERFDLVPRIYGHASPGAGAAREQEASSRRARAVAAFLAKDEAAWKSLSKDATVEEVQSLLAGFDSLPGWKCDPGPVDGILGPRTRAATQAWQARFNADHDPALVVDGVVGPKTWDAFRIALSDLVGHHLAQPKWKPLDLSASHDGACLACGADHPPTSAKSFRLQSRRGARVDIIFMEKE